MRNHDVIDNGMHEYEDVIYTAAKNSAEVVQISLNVVPEKLWNVLSHHVRFYQRCNSLLREQKYANTVKFLNFGTLENFAVIILKLDN